MCLEFKTTLKFWICFKLKVAKILQHYRFVTGKNKKM